MKRLFYLFFILLFFSHIIYPEQVSLIDDKNSFGGRTILRTYDQDEQALLNYSRLFEHYDSDDRIVQIVAIVTEDFTEMTGLQVQVQHYRDTILLGYEKLFADWFFDKHDYNRLIEEVDLAGIIISRMYFHNELLLDFSRDPNDAYEFYNVVYIDDAFHSNYLPNESGNVVSMSARYVRIRSVIQFGNELIDMDENDFMIIRYLSNYLGFESLEGYYTRKVKVHSNNRSYWFYVQTSLEPFVLGQLATIRYYPIGFNGELHLMGIGFYDIGD